MDNVEALCEVKVWKNLIKVIDSNKHIYVAILIVGTLLEVGQNKNTKHTLYEKNEFETKN